MSFATLEPLEFVLLGSLSHCAHIITFLAKERTGGIMGVEVGRAVQWGLVALRTSGPMEQAAHLQIPSYASTAGLSEPRELCVLGKDLWLVRVEILAESGQTFAQVEVSSLWFRGCA